jgi:hypothetical protein
MKTIKVLSKKYGDFEVRLSREDYSKVKGLPIGVKTEGGTKRTLVPYLYEKGKQKQLSSYLFGNKGRVISYKDGDHFNLTRSNVKVV